MTERKSTPPEAALVAIDIAKARNEVLIDPGHGRRRRMTVLNTRAEHDRFIVTLHALARPIVVGLEPTGNYHRVLAHRLIVAGFEVRLISGMALARTREALYNGWDKNDPKDAQVILHMLRIGATMAYQDPLAAGSTTFRSCRRPMRSSPRPRPSSGIGFSPIICRSIFPRSSASPGTRAATGSWRFSSAFPRRPASLCWRRTPSSLRPGTWRVGRCQRPACSVISMRPHAPQPLFRCRWMLRRSPCSAWSWHRPAA